ALDELVKEFPPDQPLIIGGDLNNHIEAAVDGRWGYIEDLVMDPGMRKGA
ncbi:hypothetical protein Tco_0577139, partial [Tanacetum coccineum]